MWHWSIGQRWNFFELSTSLGWRPRVGLSLSGKYLLLAALASYSVLANRAPGQSFLQKLESVVRERLNESQLGEALNAEVARPAGAVGSEELPTPAPQVEQPPNTAPSGTVPDDAAAAAAAPRAIYLGLEAEEVTGSGIGVRVTAVTQNSPAWKAGFSRNDRIMAINGFAIADLDDMVQQLGKAAPGEAVKFLVLRGDRNVELVAVLMEAGLAERIAGTALPVGPDNALRTAGTSAEASPWLGVNVSDLTTGFRNQFGLAVYRGAAITDVAPGSPAAKAGMAAGDAIISAGGLPIETAADLMRWINASRPGQNVEIKVQRGSSSRTIVLTLEVNPDQLRSRTAARSSQPNNLSAQAGNSLYNEPVRPRNNASGQNALPLPALVPPPASAGNLARSSESSPASPQTERLQPNLAAEPSPSPQPSEPVAAAENVDSSEVAALRRQVVTLQAELRQANERLELLQRRLRQILEGVQSE